MAFYAVGGNPFSAKCYVLFLNSSGARLAKRSVLLKAGGQEKATCQDLPDDKCPEFPNCTRRLPLCGTGRAYSQHTVSAFSITAHALHYRCVQFGGGKLLFW